MSDSGIAGVRPSPLVSSLRSVTLVVPDVHSAAATLATFLGYHVVDTATVDEALRRRWRVAPGSVDAEAVTLAAPGATHGMLRLVHAEAAGRERFAARWACVELVVADVDALVRRAGSYALRVVREPVTVDLRDEGSILHRSAVVSAAGGAQLMLTQALSEPTGRSFAVAGGSVGPVFAAHLRSAELPRALALYRDTLRMDPFLVLRWRKGWWHDFWRLPPADVEVQLLRGTQEGAGTVELQGYPPDLLDATAPAEERLDGGVSFVTLASPRPREAHERLAAGGYDATGDADAGFCVTGAAGERLEIVPEHRQAAEPPR